MATDSQLRFPLRHRTTPPGEDDALAGYLTYRVTRFPAEQAVIPAKCPRSQIPNRAPPVQRKTQNMPAPPRSARRRRDTSSPRPTAHPTPR
jgi:hypothetical protein